MLSFKRQPCMAATVTLQVPLHCVGARAVQVHQHILALSDTFWLALYAFLPSIDG